MDDSRKGVLVEMKNSDLKLVYGYKSDWLPSILEIFNKTEMKRSEKYSEKVNRGFSNSQVVASLWSENRLVAVGRMITDFEMYSSIFDVVVDPEFQKLGLGRRIMTALIEKAPRRLPIFELTLLSEICLRFLAKGKKSMTEAVLKNDL